MQLNNYHINRAENSKIVAVSYFLLFYFLSFVLSSLMARFMYSIVVYNQRTFRFWFWFSVWIRLEIYKFLSCGCFVACVKPGLWSMPNFLWTSVHLKNKPEIVISASTCNTCSQWLNSLIIPSWRSILKLIWLKSSPLVLTYWMWLLVMVCFCVSV